MKKLSPWEQQVLDFAQANGDTMNFGPDPILIACEFSGTVRDAFRKRGLNAWSCDLLKGLGHFDFFHIRCDITTKSDDWFRQFRLMIAHPPCDRLLVAGALHWAKWRASGEQQKGIDFFLRLWNAPIQRICLENPVGVMSTKLRQPDQYIEPWQFGHMETKKTGLWLRGLPKLSGTKDVYAEMMKLPPRERNRVHHESPGIKNGLTRSQRRAIFFPGWADAMAAQWGRFANAGVLVDKYPALGTYQESGLCDTEG